MVCKAQVVVETPVQDFFSFKIHVRPYFAFQLWEGEITMGHLGVFAERTPVLK
jgi:hypothetical protein